MCAAVDATVAAEVARKQDGVGPAGVACFFVQYIQYCCARFVVAPLPALPWRRVDVLVYEGFHGLAWQQVCIQEKAVAAGHFGFVGLGIPHARRELGGQFGRH